MTIQSKPLLFLFQRSLLLTWQPNSAWCTGLNKQFEPNRDGSKLVDEIPDDSEDRTSTGYGVLPLNEPSEDEAASGHVASKNRFRKRVGRCRSCSLIGVPK